MPNEPKVIDQATSNVEKPNTESLCFETDEQMSLQLSLFAEEMEAKKLDYDKENPSRLQDCSGIFYQSIQFVASICDQYEYPSHLKERDSRSIAKWYALNGDLTLINDPMAQRDLIRPGSALFFGKSGVKHTSFTKEDLSAPYPNGLVGHIGIVTEIKKGADGHLEGYVMFHGRRPGKTAQRSHYHSIEPPRSGFPILGNWNQQLLGVAHVLSKEKEGIEKAPAIADANTSKDKDAPTQGGFVVGSGSINNTLPSSPMDCFDDEATFSTFLTAFAEKLEAQKLEYDRDNPSRLQDCSGIFHRVAQHVQDNCTNGYIYPSTQSARDSRSLVRWYNSQQNLVLISDPMQQRSLIKPGAVMFFGSSGKFYQNFTVDKLSAPYPNGFVEHIGVVTEVKKDESGAVTGYVMFHGRRPGKHAQRSHYHGVEPPRLGYPILGNWNQQWLAISMIMTPQKESL